MAAAYTAAPATAPRPIPTEVPLTACELPESPPIGAPSPPDPDAVAAGFSDGVPYSWSMLAPGRMGMVGLIIDIKV